MSTLLEDWEEFERNVLGTDFGVAQRRVATLAFHFGALTIADRLVHRVTTEKGVDHQFVIDLHVECQAVANALARSVANVAVEMSDKTRRRG
jgi:hypothetical protein